MDSLLGFLLRFVFNPRNLRLEGDCLQRWLRGNCSRNGLTKWSQIHWLGVILWIKGPSLIFSDWTDCFTAYSVLSSILLPKHTFLPFAQLQACIFIFGFLKMIDRPGAITYTKNNGWLSEKLPKVKGLLPISHENNWVYFPLFSDINKEAWGLSSATSHQV